MEILDMYINNKINEENKIYEEKKAEIKKADRYEIARRKCADVIDDLYKELNNGVSYYENHNKVFKWAEGKLIEKDTLEKLDELQSAYDDKICEIELKKNEINAMLNIAETFEQKMEILKNYKIVDKNGIFIK